MSEKVTRRLVIGTIAERLDAISRAWPRNHQALAARIEGPKAARALSDLSDVLRTLEDSGVEAAWEDLTMNGYGVIVDE